MESIIETENLSKNECYEMLHQQWAHLYDHNCPWYSNFSNAAALIKNIFNFWWVGFYIIEKDMLVLGPFQGPIACTQIAKNKGVCGAAWMQEKSIVVPNVHLFDGHIACSSASNSEIVIPIKSQQTGAIWGVLDLDSEHLNHFDEIDRVELEKFCASLGQLI